MKIILDNLGWPSVLTSVLKFWKKEAEVSISEWCHVRQTWGASPGFVNEKRPQANECRQFLKAGKGKGIGPTLKPPEMSQPYWNVDFSGMWPLVSRIVREIHLILLTIANRKLMEIVREGCVRI